MVTDCLQAATVPYLYGVGFRVYGCCVLCSHLSGIGTYAYAAPEVLLGRECNEKVDIYR